MVDYNFFMDYKVKKVQASRGVQIANLIFLISLISLTSYIGFNYMLLNNQREKLDLVKLEIDNVLKTDQLIRIVDKQELLFELESIVSSMTAAGENIDNGSPIDEYLLAVIADALPSDVRLISVAMTGQEASISGEAMSIEAIAEFEYRLNQIESFYEVFIGGIANTEEDKHTFVMTLKVGGVDLED